MKFIHIADVHFDIPMISLRGNREFIKKRRIEQKQAFRDVIQLAKKEKVDCLFISGDLFEQKFVENNTIEYIISNFQLIPNVSIFISPGNHDPYIKDSPYETFEWPDNVTIFKNDYGMISLEDCDIYGVGFENYEEDLDVIKDINIEDESKINILVTHGTLNGAMHKYHDIKERDLKKFDYVALGHIHEKKVDDSRIIYPGSLISCGFDEPGEHGFVKGEITKDGCEIEFISTNCKEYKRVEIDISNFNNFSEVIEKLNMDDSFYRIILKGTKNFNLDELIDSIKELGKNVCEIRDKTTLPYDFESIKNQENLKGVFTKKILDEMENMTDDEKNETLKTIELIYQMMK